MNVDKIISEYDFKHYSRIIKAGNYAKYTERNFKTTNEGHVYIWVEVHGRKKRIVYVGKAGKRMEARVNQHHGGFRGGSKCGVKHSNNILKGLKNNKEYLVYVRKSKCSIIFGELVCICESEEKALIKKIDPAWNKQM